MVKVNLWAGLRRFTDGHDVIEVEAKNIDDILKGVSKAYPALKEIIDSGISVSVDGRIISSGVTEPVNQNSEVFLLQQLKGG